MEDGSTVVFRPRPATVAAGFVLLFGVIANLAWATAITTTGPWFGASVGIAVYSVSLVLASFLAIVLVLQASSRATHMDASLIRLERRIALLRAAAPRRESFDAFDDFELDVPSDGVTAGGSRALVRVEREGHDTLLSLPSGAHESARGARAALLSHLAYERTAIREARAEVWSMAAGPVLMALGFLAIAAPMLPGADGFATAHYILNTTLILFLSYGTVPLVAWSLVALGMMGSSRPRPKD